MKDSGPTRLGVVVSKATGGAVVRNRWKRVVRDFLRNRQDVLLSGGDEIVIVRKATKGRPPQDIRQELEQLMTRVMPA